MTTLFELPPTKPKHPATYSDGLLPVFVDMLRPHKPRRVLDPFGGTGKVFVLESILGDCRVEAVEIEGEWASLHPKMTVGNALSLPWGDDYFDAIVTSPVYGNRMSDCHNARDDSRRNTYTHILGRQLHPDNAGRLQWGDKYRDFHRRAWVEARRVLRPDGVFVLNCKDHYRAGKPQAVTQWHIDTLVGLGFVVVDWRRVSTPCQRQGANGRLRFDYENVVALELKHKSP